MLKKGLYYSTGYLLHIKGYNCDCYNVDVYKFFYTKEETTIVKRNRVINIDIWKNFLPYSDAIELDSDAAQGIIFAIFQEFV